MHRITGTVSEISSDPSCKDDKARFTDYSKLWFLCIKWLAHLYCRKNIQVLSKWNWNTLKPRNTKIFLTLFQEYRWESGTVVFKLRVDVWISITVSFLNQNFNDFNNRTGQGRTQEFLGGALTFYEIPKMGEGKGGQTPGTLWYLLSLGTNNKTTYRSAFR